MFKDSKLTSKKRGRSKKPLTTRQRNEANEKMKEAKKTGKSGMARSKQSGFLEALARLDKTYEGNKARLSVLNRPTERAKRIRVENGPLAGSETDEQGSGEASVPPGPSPFSALSEEVRARIWTYVVVEQDGFIWPRTPVGAEQPDLAMTCRTIREEVLPIFYGQNIFAVDISLPADATLEMLTVPRADDDEESNVAVDVKPHAIFYRWARVLESSGHFAMIRNWVFSYSSLLLGDGQAPAAEKLRDELLVVVDFYEDSEHWRARAGVHRNAMCVMPTSHYHDQCVPKPLPDWLQTVVGAVAAEAGTEPIRWETVGALATCLMACGGNLVGSRCEPAIQSVEIIEA